MLSLVFSVYVTNALYTANGFVRFFCRLRTGRIDLPPTSSSVHVVEFLKLKVGICFMFRTTTSTSGGQGLASSSLSVAVAVDVTIAVVLTFLLVRKRADMGFSR